PARLAVLALLFLALAAGFPAAAWAAAQEEETDPLSLVLEPDIEPDLAPSRNPSQGKGQHQGQDQGTIQAGPPAGNDADAPALVLDPDPDPEKPTPEGDPNEAGPGEGEADLSAPGMIGENAGSIPIMLVEAAYLAHRRGDFKAAMDGYTRIIRRRGLTKRERAVCYLLRGEAKRDDGQLDEAILDFTRALRQWPGYPAAHYFRGRIHEKRNKLNDAYADLAMAAQLDPLRGSYQTTLSLLKLRLKEAGLLTDGPPPVPIEPRLPEDQG
ncbi:MAG: tetratricopeptide repeat protein, partial [Candidatus Adiutrix sp.]|nr:tetratricopeptide repeat protein [Candidatus Adiutrix sp.]